MSCAKCGAARASVACRRGCGLHYCTTACAASHWSSHALSCTGGGARLSALKTPEPLWSATGHLALAARPLAPLVPIELRVDNAALMAYQGGALVGRLELALGRQLGELVARAPAWLAPLAVEVRGATTQQGRVPVQVLARSTSAVKAADWPALRDALTTCLVHANKQRWDMDDLVTEARDTEATNQLQQTGLRNVVLRHVLNTPTEDVLMCRAGSAPAPMPVEVLLLVMYHLSLRDACRLCRVCKSWNAAINGAHHLWDPIVWWDGSLYAKLTTLRTPAATHTDYLAALQRYLVLPSKARILAMLTLPDCCSSCGVPLLMVRARKRAQKDTPALHATSPSLRFLPRVCCTCVGTMVVALMSVRNAFPEISKPQMAQLPSLKVEARKCHLWCDVLNVARITKAEALAQRALAQGVSAIRLWELENAAKLGRAAGSKGGGVKGDAMEGDDEENDDGDDNDANGDEGSDVRDRGRDVAAADRAVTWVPRALLDDTALTAEEWDPAGPQVVVQRNFALLRDLQLIEQVGQNETYVAFAVTLESPTLQRKKREKGREASGKRRKGRADDDDSDFDAGDAEALEEGRSKTRKSGRKRDGDDDEEEEEDEDEDAEPEAVGGIPSSADVLAHDPDVLALLNRFGCAGQPSDRPDYRTVRSRYKGTLGAEDAHMLAYAKGDEIVVAYWSDKRQWSVGYVVSDSFDYESLRRKLGWFPNNHVEVLTLWSQQPQKKQQHRKRPAAGRARMAVLVGEEDLSSEEEYMESEEEEDD